MLGVGGRIVVGALVDGGELVGLDVCWSQRHDAACPSKLPTMPSEKPSHLVGASSERSKPARRLLESLRLSIPP